MIFVHFLIEVSELPLYLNIYGIIIYNISNIEPQKELNIPMLFPLGIISRKISCE